MTPKVGSDAAGNRLSIGLDIGGTKTEGVILDAEDQVQFRVKVPTLLGEAGVLESVDLAVGALLSAAGQSLSTVASIGVGIPGLVDPVNGLVSHAVNVGIGSGFALAPGVSLRHGGVPVAVENDLNVAALGCAVIETELERHRGVTPAIPDLAFLAIGTGLAAGVVLDGTLRRGSTGAAGEIGHISWRGDGPRCACGQIGCLELTASGSALAARWGERDAAQAPLLPVPRRVFDAAGAGDSDAAAIIEEFVAAVAWAVQLLVLTYDVRTVVLGGGVSAVGAPLQDAVRRHLETTAHTSDFLEALEISSRVRLVEESTPVGGIGAAVAGRKKAESWRS